MVIGDGAWNLDLFRLWLLKEVIRRIEEIPSPHSAAEVDRIIWGGTSTGSFFVKSAYEKLRESSWNLKEGYDNVLIQTDSLEVVKAIQENLSNGSNSTLVRRIHSLLSWIGHWSVWHISREDNQDADSLVKLVYEKNNGL
ncbi:hypothetical protein J1N35_036658 [Gossypium stocksii]|uniref:RNase H type-1 domain-containing protein n=1 Tax=Gossypium stocksii TaxID=47602 RepID=A0A9D3ZKY0_9ROSI|nr:hypothetical protein J1N35_036658 [Gossypium stocksii]